MMKQGLRLGLRLGLVGLACTGFVFATELTTAEDALKRAFPAPATVEKTTAFLTDEQVAAITKEAGTPPVSKIVSYWIATNGGAPAGSAWLDTHLVRTMQETVLVVLDAHGAVRRVEVLAFHEPKEYLPSDRWFAQFEGRPSGPDLAIGRGIRTLAGATLSSRAVTDAVRRVLATRRALGAA